MTKMSKETIDYRNQFTKENYDRLSIITPKGTKEPLKDYYKEMGYKSLNDYVMQLIQKDLEEALTSVNESAKIHADIALENIRK